MEASSVEVIEINGEIHETINKEDPPKTTIYHISTDYNLKCEINDESSSDLLIWRLNNLQKWILKIIDKLIIYIHKWKLNKY